MVDAPLVITAATPQTLISATIAANSIPLNGQIEGVLWGNYLNTTGGVRTYELRALLNAVQLYRDTCQGKGSSATRRGWRIVCNWQHTTDDDNATFGGHMMETNTLTAPDVGLNALDVVGSNLSPSLPLLSAGEVAGMAWEASQTVALQLALSTAEANHEFVVLGGYLRRILPP